MPPHNKKTGGGGSWWQRREKSAGAIRGLRVGACQMIIDLLECDS